MKSSFFYFHTSLHEKSWFGNLSNASCFVTNVGTGSGFWLNEEQRLRMPSEIG
jgi:hypothetical protein